MSTPHFQQQQMHRQAVQSAQRAHQQAVASARRPMGSTPSSSLRWNGGSPSRSPVSFVGFLFTVAFLSGIVFLAITFGPQVVDRMQEQVDTGTGTETPAPEGP